MSYRNELPEGTTDRLEVLLKTDEGHGSFAPGSDDLFACAARISSKANSRKLLAIALELFTIYTLVISRKAIVSLMLVVPEDEMPLI